MFPKKENILEEIYKILWLFLILLTIAVFYYYILPAVKQILVFLVPIVVPFIFALLIAMLIEPLVERTQSLFRLNRFFSTLFVMLFFILVFSALIVLMISRLLVELNTLSEIIPSWSQWFSQYNTKAMLSKLQTYYFSLHIPDYVLKVMQDSLNNIVKIIKLIVSETINGLVSFLASLPYIFMVSIVILVATFFLSKDKNIFLETIFNKFSPRSKQKALIVMKDLNGALAGFIRAQVLLVSITGFLTIIGLSLLNVNYAITIGLLTAIAEFLPIVGTGSIFIPWLLMEFLLGKLRFGIALLVLWLILVVVRQIIEPKILSHSIGLHPLVALMSLFIGLKILGAWGIILGPATVVIMKSLRKANII